MHSESSTSRRQREGAESQEPEARIDARNFAQRYGGKVQVRKLLERWVGRHGKLSTPGGPGLWLLTARASGQPLTGHEGSDFHARKLPTDGTADPSDVMSPAAKRIGWRPGSLRLVAFDVDVVDGEKLKKVGKALDRDRFAAAFPGALLVASWSALGGHAYFLLPDGLDPYAVIGRKYEHLGLSGEILCMGRYAAIADAGTLEQLMAADAAPPAVVPDALLSQMLADGKPKPRAKRPSAEPRPKRERERSNLDPWTRAEMEEMLSHVRGDEYDDWAKIGSAIYSWDAGHRGLTLFNWWSANHAGGDYEAHAVEAKWSAFAGGGDYDRVSVGTIYHLAEQAGWKPPAKERGKPKMDAVREREASRSDAERPKRGPRPKRPAPPFGLDEIEELLSKRTKAPGDLDGTAKRLVGWIEWAKKRGLDWFVPKGNTDDPTPGPLRDRVTAVLDATERAARSQWRKLLAKHRFEPVKPPKRFREAWKEHVRALNRWKAACAKWDAQAPRERLADAQAAFAGAELPDEYEPRARPSAPDHIIALEPERSMAACKACLAHMGYEYRLNARSQRPQVRNARKHAGAGPFVGWYDMSDEVRDRIIDDIALFVVESPKSAGAEPKPYRWSVEAFERGLSAWGADAIDPFRSWLLGLERDPNGKRIDDVLHEVFGADADCPLTRWASRSLFMVAVQRCIEIPGELNTGPGAHVKAMTILHGGQRFGKSPFLKHLLPPAAQKTLFSDSFDFASDAKTQLECQLGRVIIECGELTGMFGAALARLKVAIAKSDLSGVRMAFRRNTIDFPRRDYIVGTSDAEGGFLPPDTAGNTRFIVAELKHGCNVEEYLDAHRDQLWADAVHQYLHEGVRAPLPRELQALQAESNERHRNRDSGLEEKLFEVARDLDNPETVVTTRWIATKARYDGRWTVPPSGGKEEGPIADPEPDAPNGIEIWTPAYPSNRQSTLRLEDALRFTGWTERRDDTRPWVTDPDDIETRPRSAWSPPPIERLT